MKLLELRVYGLFGHFNHVIKLNNEENITIITAPNGYGKTILLKIIDAIFNRKFSFLLSLYFSSIEVKTDSYLLNIERHGKKKNSIILIISLAGDKNKEFKYDQSKMNKHLEKYPVVDAEHYLPWLDRVGPREWHDDSTGRVLYINDVIELYGDEMPYHRISSRKNILPKWLVEITKSLNIHLIQDQRLILRTGLQRAKHRRTRVIDTIEKYAAELAAEIKLKSAGSSEISQRLDSSFPSRLLKKEIRFSPLSIQDLKKRLSELKIKREKLSGHNIIASDHVSQFVAHDEIKDEDTKVLTLYVNDAKKKLQVYDDILQRIDLFTEILNEKRLAFKKIEIDIEKGFHFITDKFEPLQLTQLSSGEQHEVVLLYELIFRAKDNVLVLIDEPEISLHIAWQKEFLTDLKRIIKLQNVSAIISTHSPQIIDNNWHLVVDLEEGVL
jgi:predicted ATP-binding protein involved in virulence